MRPYCMALGLMFATLHFCAVVAQAGEPCCAHCGCGECQKTCRLVREEKKVTITCYGCVCEDFCVPGPSTPGCQHCEEACESCPAGGATAANAKAKAFVWTDWIPGCATIYTRKKLVKKTVTKTVPSFKWVVEDLCPSCQAKCPPIDVPADVQLPAPPAVPAKVISHRTAR